MPDNSQQLQTWFFMFALPVIGVTLIAFAILGSARLQHNSFDFSKGGFGIKGNVVGLLIGIGACFVGSEIFFRYAGYQRQITGLNADLLKTQAQVGQLQASLDGLRRYELTLNPIFPDAVDPRRATIQVLVKREGNEDFEPVDSKTLIGPSDVWITLPILSRGDRFRLVVREADREWASADLEIPRAQIQLVRQSQ